MIRTKLRHGDGHLKGEWHLVVVNSRRTARVGCLGCGDSYVLAEHFVDKRGMVSPEFYCHQCGRRDFLKLLSWSEQNLKGNLS